MGKRVVVIRERIDTGSRQCVGKKKYTLPEAKEAANAATFSGRVYAMKVYPCPEGNHWHISHLKSNKELLALSVR